jgi:hypothetical protein
MNFGIVCYRKKQLTLAVIFIGRDPSQLAPMQHVCQLFEILVPAPRYISLQRLRSRSIRADKGERLLGFRCVCLDFSFRSIFLDHDSRDWFVFLTAPGCWLFKILNISMLIRVSDCRANANPVVVHCTHQSQHLPLYEGLKLYSACNLSRPRESFQVPWTQNTNSFVSCQNWLHEALSHLPSSHLLH